ncbi:MAG: 8-oxo-dGTP diphosphatase [Candidatus Liptonbacteria bacterium]
MEELRKASLVLLVREGEVLLAMKKRGFAAGRWNGVGGKLEPGETIEQCAVRESEEEIGVRSGAEDLERVANLRFFFPAHKKEWNQEVVIYLVHKWQGEPKETEEMQPWWFKHANIPYAEMWPGDIHWLPRVLAGEKLEGEFYFSDEGNSFEKYELRNIDI